MNHVVVNRDAEPESEASQIETPHPGSDNVDTVVVGSRCAVGGGGIGVDRNSLSGCNSEGSRLGRSATIVIAHQNVLNLSLLKYHRELVVVEKVQHRVLKK